MTACPRCGEPISTTEEFCPACGAEVLPEAAVPEEAAAPESVIQTEEEISPAEEPAPAEEPVTEEESAPAEEPVTEEESAPAEEPVPEEESAPAEEPATEEESAPAEEPVTEEESAPAEEPATEEESAPAEGPAPEEEPVPEKRPGLLETLRRMREEQKPAILFNAELRRKVLRRIGYTLTALGLLALLGLALFLIHMQRQQKVTEAEPVGKTSSLPARTAVINYFTPPEAERVRTEAELSFLPDELIAVAEEGIPYTDMERFFGERGIRVAGYVELTETYQLRLSGKHSLYGLGRLIEELEAEEQIACAAVHTVWEPAGCTVPEDPWDKSADWEEMKPGASNWGLAAVGAPESWERFEPGTVRLGLIDSAFDGEHEDLRFGLLRANESYSRSRSAEQTELWQHGTAVAAVAGALHDNELGLSGAAEDCLLYAFGSSGLCCQMEQISALAELANQDVRVIQLGLSWQEELLEEISREDARARRYYWSEAARVAEAGLERLLAKDYDFLLVLPAGNGIQGEGADAALVSPFAGLSETKLRQRILVVGAAGLNRAGELTEASFSGRGDRVDLLAPGVDIYTALPQGNYGRLDGTSLAASFVSATAAEAWAMNPALSGAELGELLRRAGETPVAESETGLLDMTAALAAAEKGAKALPDRAEEELALDAYAALLHEGVQLQGRDASVRLPARHYLLLDMDGDGLEELLVYALSEQDQSASFAVYGFRNGELWELGNAWETCRFASWANMSLTLEVCEGRFLYAAAEKNSGSYGEMGERFWLRYDGAVLSSEPGDQRREGGETLLLIEDGVITDGGIPIGSARDTLWDRIR